MFLLLKRNNNFEDNKVRKKRRKKSSTPSSPKMAVFAEKLRFSNFSPKKYQLGANQY